MIDLPKAQLLPQVGPFRYRGSATEPGSADLRDVVERLGGIEARSVGGVGWAKPTLRPVSYHPGRHVWTDGNGGDIARELAVTLDEPVRLMARRINGEVDDLIGIHRRTGAQPRHYLEGPSPEAPAFSPPLLVSRARYQAWLSRRLNEWPAAEADVPDPVARRLAFVLQPVAQLP